MADQATIGFTLTSPTSFHPAPFILPGIPQKIAPPPDGRKIDTTPQTWVTVAIGNERKLKEAGGRPPSVALWDDNGNRIGRFEAEHENPKVKIKQDSQMTLIVRHTENGKKDADTGYVMLSQGTDAICITMVQVSNGQTTTAWYGDVGHLCGMTWYHSLRQIGNQMLRSKCVWLDMKLGGKKNARAMSFHLKDFVPSHDKMRLYEKDTKYICGSTPRFKYWTNMEPGSEIPVFDPPLQYHPDSKDSRMEGRDKDPDRALDKEGQYDRHVPVYKRPKLRSASIEAFKERTYRRNNRPEVDQLSKRRGDNMDPDHIVVTEIEGQTAREICEHPNSVGYDIASYVDMKYCDLSERKLYDFCSGDITHNCYDANSTTVIGAINARGEESAPRKSYKTRSHWK